MNNNYPQIQELLHQKADYQARLNLLPYDGTPEVKEDGGKKYLYVRKRIGSRLSSTYVDVYSDTLYQLLLRNARDAKEYRKNIRRLDKELAQLGYTDQGVSPRVQLNLDFARANMKSNIYDQAILEGVATSFPQTEDIIDNGIVNGMTETTFEPQGTLTRAEFATMLYRIAGTPAAEAESTYSDVKTGDWYYNAVVWATEAGVVNGMGDGTFAPNDNITRQEMATMLYRLAKAEKVEEDKLASFPDAESVADWAKDAMNWAVSTEIVNGSTHDDKVNYLDPTATALRCQAAAVACRYLALSK